MAIAQNQLSAVNNAFKNNGAVLSMRFNGVWNFND